MEDFVVNFPSHLSQKIDQMYKESSFNWNLREYAKEEALCERQYGLVREVEEKEIPDGKRFHKGISLYCWGLSILNQRNPSKVKEGYYRLVLAYVEDLLDDPSNASREPAYYMLIGNPLIKESLLQQLSDRVEGFKKSGQIPKNPETVLANPIIVEQQDVINQLFTELSGSKQKINKQVFIVHGRDNSMKQAVKSWIEKLGLDPIILHEQPDMGRTIIEKFIQCSDVGYAVVLLSPDDMAYSKELTPEKGKSRARQNVILELGYFIGKLGRKKVMALYCGDENFEMPTDFAGVVYTPFDANEAWRTKLARELFASGYNVDATVFLR